MEIAVIGSGYVGTTLATGLAELGHEVTAIDIDPEVVAAINNGESPIHEPGLAELIATHSGNRLTASSDYEELQAAELVFVTVPTPSREDGSVDTEALRMAVLEAVRSLTVDGTDKRYVLAIKSTVPPPQVRELADLVKRKSGAAADRIELATNPEFLREGTAFDDFMDPDKVVIGSAAAWADDAIESAYAPLIERANPPVIRTDPETAAMIKYANNAFLAAKISLINDLGNVCKEFGIDAYEVAEAIGTDDRIGERFLRSGVGFGGSCFPKDVAAITAAAEQAGYQPQLLTSALELNDEQPARMVSLLADHIDIAGSRIAVLGLAFKPGTDDVRGSRSIPVIEELRAAGAEVVAYDPVAMENMQDRLPEIEYAASAEQALYDAEGAMVLTAWDEFETLDAAFDGMARPVVIDGRRVIDRREGLEYEGITW